jgi:hypothetical protein
VNFIRCVAYFLKTDLSSFPGLRLVFKFLHVQEVLPQ